MDEHGESRIFRHEFPMPVKGCLMATHCLFPLTARRLLLDARKDLKGFSHRSVEAQPIGRGHGRLFATPRSLSGAFESPRISVDILYIDVNYNDMNINYEYINACHIYNIL